MNHREKKRWNSFLSPVKSRESALVVTRTRAIDKKKPNCTFTSTNSNTKRPHSHTKRIVLLQFTACCRSKSSQHIRMWVEKKFTDSILICCYCTRRQIACFPFLSLSQLQRVSPKKSCLIPRARESVSAVVQNLIFIKSL